MTDSGPSSGQEPAAATVAGAALRILYWSSWPDGYRSHYPEEKALLDRLAQAGMIEPFAREPWQTHGQPKTAWRATPFGLQVLKQSNR